MRKHTYRAALFAFAALLSGCQSVSNNLQNESGQELETAYDESNAQDEDTQATETPEEKETQDGADVQDEEMQGAEKGARKMLRFVDVFQNEYEVEIKPNIKKHDYNLKLFSHDGDRLSYEGDARYRYRLGVDVSHHQGWIDWAKVKAAGYEFAFIRIGYRGYGTAGKVCIDREFFQNIQNAQAAGIDVGVYFFSQAINEEEAAEEAEFVLNNLKGYKLQLPVVYDPEHILDDDARTDDVPGEQFTNNALCFCRLVADAGYQPMIYSNMLWEAFEFDLEKLAEYPIWYADYEPLPQTPYAFDYWQYSNEGAVDGISGAADLDIHIFNGME